MFSRARNLTLLALLVVAVTTFSTPADACSPPPDGWIQHEVPDDSVISPPEGAFLVPVSMYEPLSGQENLGVITVTVLNSQDEPVAGTLNFVETLDRPIWRADAPLELDDTYRVNVTVENSMAGFLADDFSLSFGLSVDTIPASAGQETVRLEDTKLVDRALGNRVCCPVSADRCAGLCGDVDPCSECWSDAFTYLPRVETTLSVDAPESYRALVLTRLLIVESDGTTMPYSSFSAGVPNVVDFDEARERYCITVETWDLVSDARTVHAEQVACLEASALVETERVTPDLDNVIRDILPLCESFPEGYDINGPISEMPDVMEGMGDTMEGTGGSTSGGGTGTSSGNTPPMEDDESVTGSDSGCTHSGHRPPASAPWMILFLVLGALALRRRAV